MTGVATNVALRLRPARAGGPGLDHRGLGGGPPSSFIGVTLSVVLAATVSFLVASFLLKLDKDDERRPDRGDRRDGGEQGQEVLDLLRAGRVGTAARHDGPIHSIVFACDAGMGSSAMGASVLRRKVQDAGFSDVTVVNKAISNLTDTYDLVVTHEDLTERAEQKTGSAVHVSVSNFMDSPRYDQIVELLQRTNGTGGGAVAADAPATAPAASNEGGGLLAADSIVLDGGRASRDEAISQAGELLVRAGAVDPSYVPAMHEREQSVSTYMGNLLAIPHGTNEAKPRSGTRRSRSSRYRRASTGTARRSSSSSASPARATTT